MEDDLAGNATSLAFRVNRGEIVLNDANSGTVWDVQQDKPVRIDNWEAFTSKKKNKDDDEENENQTDADRRPPRAKPDSYGVRAGRTTVLHPLDNDSAPDGRLLSIVDVDQPSGGARVEISPDGQTLVLEMPEDARPARFDYFIDDGRNGLSAHAAVDVDVRGAEQNEPPALREGWKKPTYQVPHGGELAVPVLADWRDDRDGDTLLLDSAKAVGGEETGRRRPHHGRRPGPLHRSVRSRRRPPGGARRVRRHRRSLRPGHEVDELPGPGAPGPEGLRAAGRARRRTR